MRGDPATELSGGIDCGAADSLFVLGQGYRERPDGSWQYDGERPGEGEWHAHGYFRRCLQVLQGGALVCIALWKRRWLNVATGHTCHSRPPDDPVLVRSSTLVVLLVLLGWLGSEHGLHTHTPLFPALVRGPSLRTLQRWLKRAAQHALRIQQAIRDALTRRSEPRPLEELIHGGLSPPAGIERRAFADPSAVATLWRALAMALQGATALVTPLAVLLAEARGRCDGPADNLVI